MNTPHWSAVPASIAAPRNLNMERHAVEFYQTDLKSYLLILIGPNSPAKIILD